VVTLACDLDVFAPGVPTNLAAIFLARRYFTETRDMRAPCLLLICHSFFSSSGFICLSLDQRTSTVSTCIAFGFPNAALAEMQAFLYACSALAEKCVQGATLSRCADAHETIGSDLELAYIGETYGIGLEGPLFPCSVVWHHACFAVSDGGSYETCTMHRNVHSTLTGRARDVIRAASPNRL
jgi:hypothetical protein